MSFGDLINNPNFGKWMRTNPRFRGLVKEYQKTLFGEGTGLSALLARAKMHVNEENILSFTYEPTGDLKYKSLDDLWNFAKNNRALKSTRTYRARGEMSSYIGGATNPYLQRIAEQFPGHDVRVRTFDANTKEDLDWIRSQTTYIHPTDPKLNIQYGFPTTGDGTIQIFDLIDADGNPRTLEEITKRAQIFMGTAGSATKRSKILTNDRTLTLLRDPSNPIQVLTFDPARVISADPAMKSAAENLAKLQADFTGGSYEETLTKVYESMADGAGFQTAGSLAVEMKENINRGNELIKDAEEKLRRTARGTEEYEELLAQKQSGQKIVDEARSQIREGRISNTRINSAIDVANPTDSHVMHLKGNTSIIDEEYAKEIIRRNGMNPDDFDLPKIAGIFSAADKKNEFEIRIASGVTRERHKAISADGRFNIVNSDILTMSNYEGLVASQELLVSSAHEGIEEAMGALRRGEISPGLRQIIEDLASWEPLESEGPAAKLEAINAKRFVRNLQRNLDAGIAVNMDPVLTKQLEQGIKDHYTKYRRGKYKKEIKLDRQSVPYSDLSFPIKGSTRGEVVPMFIPVQGKMPLRNTIQVHNGGLGMHGITWAQTLEAFGGADLDDNLAAVLKYDPKAKRLMAFTYRNPNQMGEYMLLNADVSMDRLAPLEIKQADARLKNLVSRGEKLKTADIKEMDELKALLHEYYSGRAVSVRGRAGVERIVSQSHIEHIDVMDLYRDRRGRLPNMTAPKGYMRVSEADSTFNKGYILQGFQTSGEVLGPKSNLRSFKYRLRKEIENQTSANVAGSPLRYVGPGYDEFHDGTGFFHRSKKMQVIERKARREDDARKAREVLSRKREEATAADYARRQDMEVEATGLLGNQVNLDAVTSRLIQGTSLHGTDQQWEVLSKFLKANPITYIPTETVIDTIKKTGDARLVRLIRSATEKDTPHKLGQLVAHVQSIRPDADFIGPVIPNYGIDPIEWQTRFASPEAQASFRTGYASVFGVAAGSVSDEAITNISGQMAYHSKMLHAKLKLKEHLDSYALGDESSLTLGTKLDDMHFTPEEMVNAQTLLEKHSQAEQLRRSLENTRNPAEFEAMINRAGEFGEAIDDPNTAMLRHLSSLRLETPEALDRQLLAALKLNNDQVLEHPGRQGFSMLGVEGYEGETHIADLTRAAMQRRLLGPEVISQIKQARTVNELSQFIKNGEFTDATRAIFDPMERNVALLNSIFEASKVSTKHRGELYDMAHAVLEDMGSSRVAETESGYGPHLLQMSYNDHQQFSSSVLQAIQDPFQYPMDLTIPMPSYTERGIQGVGRYTEREAADVAADFVVKPGAEKTMKLFGMKEFENLWEHKPSRNAIIGIGLFAAFGILHRALKDPSEEDMQGPPLMPGGSPYEDYKPSSYYDIQSMYPSMDMGPNQQSMSYQVHATGKFDAKKLSKQISSISGTPVRGDVSQQRQTLSGRPSSTELVNTMLGAGT